MRVTADMCFSVAETIRLGTVVNGVMKRERLFIYRHGQTERMQVKIKEPNVEVSRLAISQKPNDTIYIEMANNCEGKENVSMTGLLRRNVFVFLRSIFSCD